MAGFYPNVWVLIYSGQYFLFSCCGPVFSIGFPISWCLKLMKRYEYYAHSTVLIMKSTYICHYILKCKYVLPIKYLEVFSAAFLQSRIFFKSENFFMIMMVYTQNNFDQNNMSHCFYLDIAEEKKKKQTSYCSVVKSCLTLWPHELQHTKLPCPSLSPGVCSNSAESVIPSNHPHPLSPLSPHALNLSQHQGLLYFYLFQKNTQKT